MKQTYGRVPKTTMIDKIFVSLSAENQELIDKFIEYKRGSVSDSRLRILFNSSVKFADLMEMDLDKADRDDVTKGWNRIYASEEISGKSNVYDAEVCRFCNFALVQRETEVAEVRNEMDGWVEKLLEEMARRDGEHAAF